MVRDFFILGGMKKLILPTILFFTFTGCEEGGESNLDIVESETEINEDTTAVEEVIETVETNALPSCLCDSETRYFEDIETIVFANGEDSKNSTLLEELDEENKNDEVKYLELKGYNSIPSEFLVFQNVQHITFRDSRGINLSQIENIDQFKTLQSIGFKMSQVTFNGQADWMDQIKYFYARKTQFKALPTFKWFPNLITLDFETSGFNSFPTGIDSLYCIQYINFFETREEINQSDWNFENSKCLEYYDFYTSYNTLKGVPFGLEDKEMSHFRIKKNSFSEDEQTRHDAIKKK